MNSKSKAYLQIHIAVFLFGFTAILGKLITLPEAALVWWRMILTSLSLLMLPVMLKHLSDIPRRTILKLVGIGGIVAFHWIFFFGGVKYSNVSVTLSCMATATFFTSIIEPIILRKRFKWYELALGLLVVPGIYLIFSFTSFYAIGMAMALFSAFLAAVFGVLNKPMANNYNAVSITFVELGSGALIITPLLPLYYYYSPDEPFLPTGWQDWLWIAILAFVCTSFAYVITLKALKQLTPFTVSLTINLEPIYGIIMAWAFFQENEELDLGFYAGAGLVLLSVFLHPFLDKWFGSGSKEVSKPGE